jgi:type I restriction enzyme R subunit
VRFAPEQQPALEPFADSVQARFDSWLRRKDSESLTHRPSPLTHDPAVLGSAAFTPEQLAWLHLIRGHIATSLAIDTDDFGYSPLAQRGGLGRAHQLFGEQLPQLLEELNETLAA